MHSLRSVVALAAAPLALLLFAGHAPAEEFYYLLMFGAQASPNDPEYAHTFATFVRAYGDGPCPPTFVVEDCFTISWMPSAMNIRTHALRPEEGHNFTLPQTLYYALSNDERVSMWGPYRIEQELYDDAVRQVGLLQSGQVRYKAIDSGYPIDRVSNCIHAVAGVVAGDRPRVLSPGFGDTASWSVLQCFRPWILDDGATHEWVYYCLGLDYCPIVRRDYDGNPRPGGPLRIAAETARALGPASPRPPRTAPAP